MYKHYLAPWLISRIL